MEEPPQIQRLSPDEIQVEAIFTSSIQQLESGRFSVALPFKHRHPIPGYSRSGALKRFPALNIVFLAIKISNLNILIL